METLNDIAPFLPSHLQQGDYVALTFFLTSIAMTAGAVFFFLQFFIAPAKWKNSLLIMGMILTIAALNYFYMRDYWVERRMSPTEFRYFDWLLTVPLICTEFYLLISRLGVRRRKLYVMLIASIWMLFWGYYGEAIDRENALLWGGISTLGILVVLYEIGMGIRWVTHQPNARLRRGYITLFVFTALCWNVYPIGYLTMPGLWLSSAFEPGTIDVLYNLGDILNKVIFAAMLFLLVIYPSVEYQRKIYGKEVPRVDFETFRNAYARQLMQQAREAQPSSRQHPQVPHHGQAEEETFPV